MIGVEGQVGVTEVMGYSITNQKAAATLPAATSRRQLRLTNVEDEYAKIKMWKFVENYDKWVPGLERGDARLSRLLIGRRPALIVRGRPFCRGP